MDADKKEVLEAVDKNLPKTFTVQSPGSLGRHYYYFCDLEKPIRLYDKGKVNLGDVQGRGKMVVGPGCWHPCGKQYRILWDLPIAEVKVEQLREALAEWIVPEEHAENLHARAKREADLFNIGILDVLTVGLGRLRRSGEEYFGPHPIHGSTMGRNFWVNPRKNAFYCFRHGVGGGPLTWLAIEEGIIRCEEAGPGALKGEVFKRVLEALERRGFTVPSSLRAAKSVEWNGQDLMVDGVRLEKKLLEKLKFGEKVLYNG